MARKARPYIAEVTLRFRVPKGASAAAAKRLIWNNLTGNSEIYPDWDEAEVFGEQTIKPKAVSARIIKELPARKPKMTREQQIAWMLQVGAEVVVTEKRFLGRARVKVIYSDIDGGVKLDREIDGFTSWNVRDLSPAPRAVDPGIAEAALLQAGKDPAEYGYRSIREIEASLKD